MNAKIFGFCELGETVSFRSQDSQCEFLINDGKNFINRKLRLTNGAFLFDGYATWFSGEMDCSPENFTVSVSLAPISYESAGSGIIARFDSDKKCGFHISIDKFGFVVFGFGDGNRLYECKSLGNHLEKGKWNIVTVVFNSRTGWCDIYINGVITNRKQFPRYTVIKYSEKLLFIGKYVDYSHNPERLRTGVFNGYMDHIKSTYRALSYNEVLEEHYSYLSDCIAGKKPLPVNSLDGNDYSGDVQRPGYHLIPSGKWMNEPHGPFYFNGNYHIFYQANPHAPIWDNIQWGHMISRDMVNWSDLPLALETENNGLDPDGCWSGSCCIDKSGLPVAFYTAGNNNKLPNQGIAMAWPDNNLAKPDNGLAWPDNNLAKPDNDLAKPDNNLARPDISDPRLVKWNKYENLIIEQTPADGWLGEFRDPFVWLQEDTYYMLVGTGDADNGGGNALVYTSDDLLNWNNHGFLMEYDYESNKEVGHIWELPVLLPLPDEDGKVVCHILLFCACQVENDIVDTFYFTGDWDTVGRKFIRHHERAKLLDLGNGVLTGPSGFVTPDGRTVIFTISQGKRKPDEEFNSGWAHNGGMPLELYAKNNQVCIRPVREIYSLKSKKLIHEEDIPVQELNALLENIEGNMFYVKLCTNSDYMGLSTIYGRESLEVFYDRANHFYGARKEEDSSIISRYRGEVDKVYADDNETEFVYFLDHSMIEVFFNSLKSITLRNYAESKARKLKIMAEENVIIHSFELWELKSKE